MLIKPVRLLHLWWAGGSHGDASRMSMMVGWLGTVWGCFVSLVCVGLMFGLGSGDSELWRGLPVIAVLSNRTRHNDRCRYEREC